MVLNQSQRSPLMNGLVQSAMWSNYQPILKGITHFQAGKYAVINPVLLKGMRNNSYKYAAHNPSLMSGLGDGNLLDDGSIGALIQQGILAWNTQTIANANAERVSHGLAPLDASAYAPTVNVGISTNTIMLIGAAILGVVLLTKSR